jgi:hypothetical protein
MQVILCNVNLFSASAVQVIDTDTNDVYFTLNVINDNIVPTICALANKLNINEIRIGGNKNYIMEFVEDIKSTYSLHFKNNNINVEVI